jgi:Arc/MetJ-type ribon-helix-helix transcriptional regulator
MSRRSKVRVTITLPSDLVEWAKNAVKEGRYAGIRSFSGLVELLLKREMEKYEGR